MLKSKARKEFEIKRRTRDKRKSRPSVSDRLVVVLTLAAAVLLVFSLILAIYTGGDAGRSVGVCGWAALAAGVAGFVLARLIHSGKLSGHRRQKGVPSAVFSIVMIAILIGGFAA